AAAGAVQLLLDRLDRGVIVRGGNGREWTTRASGIPQAAGRSRAREGVGALGGRADGRTGGQQGTPEHRRQELAPITDGPTAWPSPGRGEPDRLAVATHLDRGGGDLTIERIVLRDAEVRKRVRLAVRTPQRRRLARAKGRFRLGLERHAGERDEQDYDAGVHDVAAVAPPVAAQQAPQGERIGLAVLAVSRPGAPSEFLHD